MASKFSQVQLAIAILQKLSQRPYVPNELCEELHEVLETHEQSTADVRRKVSRMVSKLRDCGFEISSAPNRPYQLKASSFPVILTMDQRKSLTLAIHLLDSMGFSAQASHLIELIGFERGTQPQQLQATFSPPVDYSEAALANTVETLQDRFQKRRRFIIRYKSSRGKENTYDLDRSELRLHNGVLYLFSYVPDFSFRHDRVEKNQIFRVDRILRVGPASDIPWELKFPTLDLTYRMSGPLGSYQPRRDCEKVINRDSSTPPEWVDIKTTEESLFWFRQRLFQYRSNVRLLSPSWVVKQVAREMLKAAQNYSDITTGR
ncbi:MAG: WYL domain-containing protein [Cyanobacteria bacterium J06581_3]